MFQFLRRVSTSFLPRPDRPWRDDATSHAPTIGRKRRYSVTEHDEDDSPSMAKKAKNDAECDSASEGSSPEATLVEGQGVKEVTKGVKEVDLEDKDRVEDPSSMPPEGVPLPDSPSPSPEAEPANLDAGEQTGDKKPADDKDSVASSAPEVGTEDSGEPEVAETDDTEETTPAQDVITTTTEDIAPAESVEVKA